MLLIAWSGEAVEYPTGVYDSAAGIRHAGDNMVAQTPLISGQDGILVRAAWGLCGDDMQCLIDTLKLNLDTAASLGLKVAMAIGDGDHAPPGVKSDCQLFHFQFRGEPATMCVPWDDSYLADKRDLIDLLGQNFDTHPALSHVYFTAACSSNGYEGHCRIDEAEYTVAGSTAEKFDVAYGALLDAYLSAFPTTAITFEAHSIFDRIGMWETLWAMGKDSGRLGIAAWWCAERLAERGHDTVPVWDLVQEIAASTYAVCQTVGNFTDQPYRFSDSQLSIPLDYGTETAWTAADSERAFSDTMEWVAGAAVHAGQDELPAAFSAIEIWTQDLDNVSFQARLDALLDQFLFKSGFER